MLKIGLTGGIGSGKTTVSDLFAGHGAAIIDTDILAREVISQPSILQQIRDTFGADVFTADNHLDRKKLAQKVFSQADQRRKLEQLLHPAIRERVLTQLQGLAQQANTPYVIIVVPLLLETDFSTLVDRILVVSSDTEKRIERIRQRDGRDLDEIRSIIASQISDPARCEQADDIIENNSDINDLRSQVEAMHQQYLRMAANDR